MAQRKSLRTATCPVARAIDVVGDRWSLLVLRDAFDGARRFGEFQKRLGVARNILSDRLRRLVADGVLATAPASDGTTYQEYVLTERGEALFPLVVALRQWGEAELFAPGEAHSTLVDREAGLPLAPLVARAQDDRPVAADGAVVRRVAQDSAAV